MITPLLHQTLSASRALTPIKSNFITLIPIRRGGQDERIFRINESVEKGAVVPEGGLEPPRPEGH